MLGVTLGEYFVARCDGASSWQPRRFCGNVLDAVRDAAFDFDPPAQDVDADPSLETIYATDGSRERCAASPPLRVMWQRAQVECDRLHLRFDA
jgi:hypothetical protein